MSTFISAFESSPVHWEKPRPSGNLCNPGNGGAVAMLKRADIKDIEPSRIN